MTRRLKHTLIAAAILGGIGFAGVPAQAMPVTHLAPAADAVPAGSQIDKVYWRRHWGWHRHWGWRRHWHRHWGWHRRWHRW